MSDIRELLATAEAIGFKIHNRNLEVERIGLEIAELNTKLEEARAEVANSVAELEGAYDQCVAAGLPRDKVVNVVEGMITLLIGAGAAPEATTKTQVRKTRRSRKNVDGGAEADTVSANEVVTDPTPPTPAPSVVSPETTGSSKDQQTAQVTVEAAAPAPIKAQDVPAAVVASPVVPVVPVAVAAAPVEAPPLAHDPLLDNDLESEGGDDETFGVDVELFGAEDQPEGDHDFDEDDFEERASAAPANSPPVNSPPVPETGTSQPSAGGGFRRPSFLK